MNNKIANVLLMFRQGKAGDILNKDLETLADWFQEFDEGKHDVVHYPNTEELEEMLAQSPDSWKLVTIPGTMDRTSLHVMHTRLVELGKIRYWATKIHEDKGLSIPEQREINSELSKTEKELVDLVKASLTMDLRCIIEEGEKLNEESGWEERTLNDLRSLNLTSLDQVISTLKEYRHGSGAQVELQDIQAATSVVNFIANTKRQYYDKKVPEFIANAFHDLVYFGVRSDGNTKEDQPLTIERLEALKALHGASDRYSSRIREEVWWTDGVESAIKQVNEHINRNPTQTLPTPKYKHDRAGDFGKEILDSRDEHVRQTE